MLLAEHGLDQAGVKWSFRYFFTTLTTCSDVQRVRPIAAPTGMFSAVSCYGIAKLWLRPEFILPKLNRQRVVLSTFLEAYRSIWKLVFVIEYVGRYSGYHNIVMSA